MAKQAPARVVLIARGYVSENLGGGVKDLHSLLKGYERLSPTSFRLNAIFADRFVESYSDLQSRVGAESSDVARFSGRKPSGEGRSQVDRFFRITAGLLKHMLDAAWRTKSDFHLYHAFDFLAAYICSLCIRRAQPLILTIPYKGGWAREVLLQNPTYRGTALEGMMRRIEIEAVRGADVITFPSRASIGMFEQEHPGLLDGKDVRITYNGPDLEELDSVPVEKLDLDRFGVPSGSAVILYVGPLIADKGPDTLVDSMALLASTLSSQVVCVLVGRGHLENHLMDRITEAGLGDRLKLLGLLPRREFLQLMRIATLFVLPSRVSVFDYVLLEAGALGLPLVTTAIGGNLEMFDSESAILVPPDEPEILARAIDALLSDKSAREELGFNARNRIRSRFSVESMFNSYASIYEELLRRTRSDPISKMDPRPN